MEDRYRVWPYVRSGNVTGTAYTVYHVIDARELRQPAIVATFKTEREAASAAAQRNQDAT